MKNIKIAIQNGLGDIFKTLQAEGFDVYQYGHEGLDADVTIITGIDEAYQEIQPAEYHANGKKAMLVVDATNRSHSEILKQIHRYYN